MEPAPTPTGLLLLRVSGTSPPVYIVREEDLADGWDDESYEHFYESKLCPSDVIRCEAVIEGEDVDPHGIFEFVQIIPRPDDWPFVGLVDFARYAAAFDKLGRGDG